ncbi:hypothetical protein [Halobaculum sp. D14]|uniref:hypothetical protein n=1 Tax=unclassified Halobaculum TaxID=2640896 RepID=UPI003EBB9675
MGGTDTEACGRCAMSSTAGLVDGDADPFDGDRIELSDREARAASPAAWLGGVVSRLDGWVESLTYDR